MAFTFILSVCRSNALDNVNLWYWRTPKDYILRKGKQPPDLLSSSLAFPLCQSIPQFSFPHGTFEKVNYLGYDDHVVLNRSISFLLGEDASGGTDRDPARVDEDERGKLLTILTVRPWCQFTPPRLVPIVRVEWDS